MAWVILGEDMHFLFYFIFYFSLAANFSMEWHKWTSSFCRATVCAPNIQTHLFLKGGLQIASVVWPFSFVAHMELIGASLWCQCTCCIMLIVLFMKVPSCNFSVFVLLIIILPLSFQVCCKCTTFAAVVYSFLSSLHTC